jgi:hypothetical protein
VRAGQSERPPWLLQLHRRGAEGEPAEVLGAGFRAGDGYVVTCAHVIAKILGTEESAAFKEVEGQRVLATRARQNARGTRPTHATCPTAGADPSPARRCPPGRVQDQPAAAGAP